MQINVTVNDRRERNRRHRHHHHEHCHRGVFYWFVSSKTAVLLYPERTMHMSDTIHIDQIDNLSLVADDANLNVVPFTPDAPPVWTNSNPAAATLVASADGLTAVLTPVAIGVTTVGVSLQIGGVTFSASDDISVVTGPVASISIIATPAPKSVPQPAVKSA